jgi:hypothetical protein
MNASEKLSAPLRGAEHYNQIDPSTNVRKTLDTTSGKQWNHEEIWKGFETLFAPYAKRNATYVVEATLTETSGLFVANVLWKNALLASEQRAWMHRMSVVLISGADNWEILLAQVTPVQFPSPPP